MNDKLKLEQNILDKRIKIYATIMLSVTLFIPIILSGQVNKGLVGRRKVKGAI